LHKYFQKLIFLFAAFMAVLSLPGAAPAVNEGFNPRVMEEANKMISGYEAEILKNGASVDALEWIIRGLQIRKEAYFSDAGAAREIDAKITEKYKKILEIDPSNYSASCELIDSEMNSGSFDGKSGVLEGLVKNNPLRFQARLLKGRALFYAADFDGAIMEITKGVSMIPPEEKVETGYYKKLLESANKYAAVMKKNAPEKESGGGVIKEDSKSSDAKFLYDSAVVYLDEEMIKCPSNIDKGISLLRSAIEKDPGFADAYLKLGETLGGLKGEYKEAMNVLTKIDKVARENAVLKRARVLRQKYYKLNMSRGKKKRK